jgi:ABC-type polysaccharide/polyol phosphate transport system ATPase subunit
MNKGSIHLENVGFDYQSHSIFNRRKQKKPQTLTNIDLKIAPGEVVGILGHNGAGKSTLLRLIAGIYSPTSGSVDTIGRTSLLANVGTGFQREMTGRDNIILSGLIQGFTLEHVMTLVPSISVFSGLGQEIDEPIRTYSSGMRARLGFSIIAHMNPDIFLIDEIFTVGDASFREISKERILDMVNGNATVIIVTHNESIVKNFCNRVICMEEGKIILDSQNIDEGIQLYFESSKAKDKR